MDEVKTLHVMECRRCSTNWVGNETNVKLKPGEAFVFILHRKAKCSWCVGTPFEKFYR